MQPQNSLRMANQLLLYASLCFELLKNCYYQSYILVNPHEVHFPSVILIRDGNHKTAGRLPAPGISSSNMPEDFKSRIIVMAEGFFIPDSEMKNVIIRLTPDVFEIVLYQGNNSYTFCHYHKGINHFYLFYYSFNNVVIIESIMIF